MLDLLIYILIGSIAGLVMGAIGVGGGAIIIVSLIFLAHLPQKMAQCTNLLLIIITEKDLSMLKPLLL
jgi:uncharacterized membrane protein YfcA